MNLYDFRIEAIGTHSIFSVTIAIQIENNEETQIIIVFNIEYNPGKLTFLKVTCPSYHLGGPDYIDLIENPEEIDFLQKLIDPYFDLLSSCSRKNIGMILPYNNRTTNSTLFKLFK